MQAELFVVNVPTIQPLVVNLQDNTSSDQDEVYLKYGTPPTRSEYDYRDSSLAAANQRVVAPSAAPGTWYILLYADSAPSGSTFTITATAGSSLLSVAPTHSGNRTDVSLTLTGTGFNSQSTVSLVAAHGTIYPLSNVTEDSLTQMTATIVANTVPAGTYTVEVTQSDGTIVSLANAFTMIQGGEAMLTTNLVLPTGLSVRGPATLYVEYSNAGDVPMPAPLLLVTADDKWTTGTLIAFLGWFRDRIGCLDVCPTDRLQQLGPDPGQWGHAGDPSAGRVRDRAGLLRRLGPHIDRHRDRLQSRRAAN